MFRECMCGTLGKTIFGNGIPIRFHRNASGSRRTERWCDWCTAPRDAAGGGVHVVVVVVVAAYLHGCMERW
jgi:hypothetical protein